MSLIIIKNLVKKIKVHNIFKNIGVHILFVFCI